MKHITTAVGFKIDKKLWKKFVRRLLQFSRHEFASLRVTTDSASISIQQISPVPRMQRTIIKYIKNDDHIIVDQVTLESADELWLSSPEEIKEDVIHFIESFLEYK